MEQVVSLEVEDRLITFEAETAGDFEMSFRNAVDEYLKDCRRLGIEPRKTALETDDPEGDIHSECGCGTA